MTTGLEGRCSIRASLEGDLVDDAEANEDGEREGDADGEEIHVDGELVGGAGRIRGCHLRLLATGSNAFVFGEGTK